ncbi:MAG TPA: sugar ABC transporter substrate-binding protein [Candidatus Limnocylindrales bacterium]|nr:sugar ABC transporter substrate-binding protein [Candidatus Limnocylindrales bacterium]
MTEKTFTRREVLKQGAAAVGAAAFSAWTPRKTWAKPQITVWTIGFFNPKADEIIQQQFAEFAKKANADVNVVIVPGPQITRKLQTAVEGGAPPDLSMIYDSDTQYYRSIGQLLEVTDLVNEMKKEPEGLFPAALDTVEYEGKAFGVPLTISPWPLHWRKDLFEQAKLEYPKDIFEFVEVCKKLQKPPYLYGAGFCLGRALDGVDNIQNILWLFGGWMTQDEKTLSIDSPGTIEGLKFLNKMYNEDKIIPPGAINWDDSGNNKAYQSRQAIFICNPTSVYSYLSINDPDLMSKTGLSPFPPGPAGSFSLIDAWAYGAFTKTKEPNLVKDAMMWMMQPDRYARLIEEAGGRAVPVYRRLTKDEFWQQRPVFSEFLKMPEYGYRVTAKSPPTPATAEVVDSYIIPDMAQEVLVRGVDPAEAAKRAQERAQAIFDRHYKRG